MSTENFLADTHVWLWFMQGRPELKQSARELIAEASREGRAFLSVYSVWELGNLEALGRVQLAAPITAFVDRTLVPGGFRLAEFTLEIALAASRLPGEIQRDPADRILAATARQERMTLLTHDDGLLRYARQGHLKAHRV